MPCWRLAATGVVGVTALAIPQVRNSLEQEATALGRQALAHELASLEGITLDEAIKAAEITQAAVRLVVLPLAQLVATIGGDGLAVLLVGPDDGDACAQQCPYHGGRAQRTARYGRILA